MSSRPPNPLLDLLLTLVLPSFALEWLSEPARLGPFWALVVASLLPIAFGVYCYVTKSGMNFFSILGLVAVIVTGGLGLLQLNAFWFSIKEMAVPLVLGLAFPISHRYGKPVISSMLFAPHLINEKALRGALDTPEKNARFEVLLKQASYGLCLSTLVSGVINSVMAVWLIGDKAPGSPEYVKAIGTLNWAGTLAIGAPLLVAMMLVMMRFIRGVHRVTGLDRDDLMNPGRTVRRQV